MSLICGWKTIFLVMRFEIIWMAMSSGPCWNCAQGAGAPGRHLGIQDGRQYTSGRHHGRQYTSGRHVIQDGDRKCTGGHLGFQDGGQGCLRLEHSFSNLIFFCLFIPYLLSSPLAQVSLQKDLVSSRRLSVASTSEPGDMTAIIFLFVCLFFILFFYPLLFVFVSLIFCTTYLK